MRGSTSSVAYTVAQKFDATAASRSRSDSVSAGATWMMLALLTSTSTRPNRSSAAAKSRRTSSRSVTSQGTASTSRRKASSPRSSASRAASARNRPAGAGPAFPLPRGRRSSDAARPAPPACAKTAVHVTAPAEPLQGACEAPTAGHRATARAGERHLLLAALAVAAGLIVPFALVHVDDADGVVYTVVARHLAQDGRPFDLRFLPEVLPRFREHPPFFFWVWAAAIRLASERALPWVGAACGLATVAVAFAIGRRLAGPRAAFLGSVALATVDSFFRYQARARLDPPLTLLFTLSVGLLVCARGRTALLALGGLAAGLGVLVK